MGVLQALSLKMPSTATVATLALGLRACTRGGAGREALGSHVTQVGPRPGRTLLPVATLQPPRGAEEPSAGPAQVGEA